MRTRQAFEALLNFRDVGETIDTRLGSSFMVQGLLFRSARPGTYIEFIVEFWYLLAQCSVYEIDRASVEDRQRLHDVYGVRTIIDLRTKSEHLRQLEKLNLKPEHPSSTESDNDVTGPLKLPGFIYHEINLNGRNFERALFWKLSWWSRIKFSALMLAGYHLEAIAIMGREVLQPRGLVGLACDSIDGCGEEIRQVFEVLADPCSYPVLIHCTQGKDRTGLIIALLLFLLDVPLAAISHDYTVSETELPSERSERLNEIQQIGLNEDFSRARSDWVDRIHTHLVEHHGGISKYLEGIGVDETAQQKIRDHFLRNSIQKAGLT